MERVQAETPSSTTIFEGETRGILALTSFSLRDYVKNRFKNVIYRS